MKTKPCTRCKIEKPLSEFTPSRNRPDGLYYYCRECHNECGRIRRAKKKWGAYAKHCECCGRNKPSWKFKTVEDDGSRVLCSWCNDCLDMFQAKWCADCRETKAIPEFYGQSNGGFSTYCKECEKERERKRKKSLDYMVSVTEKKCTRCGQLKPASEFSRNKRISTGLSSWCKDCSNENNRARYANDESSYRQHRKVYQKWWHACKLAEKYGCESTLTLEQTQELMAKYDHCLCCGSTERLTIDHIVPYSQKGANAAGNVQVLCHSCNAARGPLDDATDFRGDPASSMTEKAKQIVEDVSQELRRSKFIVVRQAMLNDWNFDDSLMQHQDALRKSVRQALRTLKDTPSDPA